MKDVVCTFKKQEKKKPNKTFPTQFERNNNVDGNTSLWVVCKVVLNKALLLEIVWNLRWFDLQRILAVEDKADAWSMVRAVFTLKDLVLLESR